MIVVFVIWYFMITSGVVKKIGLPKIAKPKIWSLFRGNFSKRILQIFPETYKIDGIGHSMDNPNYVIINNNIYYSNDFVGGGKIINISQDGVTIQFEDKVRVYRVGHMIK